MGGGLLVARSPRVPLAVVVSSLPPLQVGVCWVGPELGELRETCASVLSSLSN